MNLPDSDFQLWLDPFDHLVYRDATGREYPDAVPLRAFPLTRAKHWVVICDADGRELRCIEDLDTLPAELRTTLEGELARREFVPQITRIIQISSYLEPAEWRVNTDRGPACFILKNEEDVRRLGPYSALLLDSQGIRYLVSDTRNLDSFSRRTVERYL